MFWINLSEKRVSAQKKFLGVVFFFAVGRLSPFGVVAEFVISLYLFFKSAGAFAVFDCATYFVV